jgi:thiol-disulfide isomerase/thioredoxin
MRSGLAILSGLLAGTLVAGGLLASVLLYTPGTGALGPAEPSPDPSPSAPASPSGPPTASPSASPTPAAAPSPSSTPESPSPSPSDDGLAGRFHIGEPAPPLVVARVGGGQIDLATLRGKPVWVNFWGTYCPPCRDEFPLMNGYAARYEDAGLVILAIDVREDEATVDAFAKELGAIFPIGLDLDGAAQGAWDALALPVHFWVDADGIVQDGALGGIGADVMASGLGTILPGVTVTP